MHFRAEGYSLGGRDNLAQGILVGSEVNEQGLNDRCIKVRCLNDGILVAGIKGVVGIDNHVVGLAIDNVVVVELEEPRIKLIASGRHGDGLGDERYALVVVDELALDDTVEIVVAAVGLIEDELVGLAEIGGGGVRHGARRYNPLSAGIDHIVGLVIAEVGQVGDADVGAGHLDGAVAVADGSFRGVVVDNATVHRAGDNHLAAGFHVIGRGSHGHEAVFVIEFVGHVHHLRALGYQRDGERGNVQGVCLIGRIDGEVGRLLRQACNRKGLGTSGGIVGGSRGYDRYKAIGRGQGMGGTRGIG